MELERWPKDTDGMTEDTKVGLGGTVLPKRCPSWGWGMGAGCSGSAAVGSEPSLPTPAHADLQSREAGQQHRELHRPRPGQLAAAGPEASDRATAPACPGLRHPETELRLRPHCHDGEALGSRMWGHGPGGDMDMGGTSWAELR